jgi:diacylglycerol kinase (ATP)
MKKFLASFVYAWRGVKIAAAERSMRVHALCAAIAIGGGFYFGITATEWCMVLLCIGLVMGLEALNTALETYVDLVSPEYHPLAGKIKDLGAGAVLIAAIAALAVGLLIFGKYILALLH